MSISLTPLEDKIIVKQAEAETQTASGLFIPDNAKEKPQQGEVLAVGPGRRNDAGERIPVDVKVGDKVLYSKYGGTEVHYQGEDYLIGGGVSALFGADLRKTLEFQRFGPFLAVATRRICISRPVCGILNGLPVGVQPNRQHGGFPKRSKGTDCKSVASCFSGSNPLSATPR